MSVEDFTEPDDGIHEVCSICGKGYMLWHSPDPLWAELIGHYAGTRCPRCFDALAGERGIRLVWTPVVVSRDGVPTTNHWADPSRDRLLVGEPDPDYHDDGKAQAVQAMRNASGQVVYVEPPEGTVVDLSPVAFELYHQADLVRHPRPGGYLGPLGNRASEFYQEAITEGDIHDSYDQGLASTEWWALTLETAAELADYMGV